MKRVKSILDLLPPPQATRSLTLGPNAVLITVAGFEDRHFAAARALTKGNTNESIILTYQPNDARNDFDGLEHELRSKGVCIKEGNIIQYNRFNPRTFSERLKRCLKRTANVRIILDISAMSKLAIMLCLNVCREINADVTIYYAEAVHYGPSKESYEKAKINRSLHRPSIQIYTGVQGVLRVPQFSSVAMQGQPTAAIGFMSFNEELIQALLNCVYPARFFLINGKPPKLKWREEATAWIHQKLLEEWPAVDNPIRNGLPIRTASTLDYRQTVAILHQLYWHLAIDHRILLAPTGSKMQTVGCFLIAALHPDVHVEYPTPDGFLNLYSEGIGEQWTIAFGPLGNYIAKLELVEKRDRLDVSAEGYVSSTGPKMNRNYG